MDQISSCSMSNCAQKPVDGGSVRENDPLALADLLVEALHKWPVLFMSRMAGLQVRPGLKAPSQLTAFVGWSSPNLAVTA